MEQVYQKVLCMPLYPLYLYKDDSLSVVMTEFSKHAIMPPRLLMWDGGLQQCHLIVAID
jgi:hypothetical protein